MFRVFSLHSNKWILILVIGDIASYCLATVLGTTLVLDLYLPRGNTGSLGFLTYYSKSFMLIGLTYLVIFYIADLYDYQRDFRNRNNISQIAFATLMGTLVVIVLFYFPLGVFVGRTLLVVFSLIFLGLMISWRITFSALALPERLQKRLLIVGAGKCGRELLKAVKKRPKGGIKAIGFVDDDHLKIDKRIDGLPVLGGAERLTEIIRKQQVNLVALAITHEKSPQLLKEIVKADFSGCQVMDMPSLYEFLAGKIPIEHISDIWFYFCSSQNSKFYYRRIKRLWDVLLAVFYLFMVAPFFLLVPLVIKLDSRGPVFFRQQRLGKDGKPFWIIKFRTMVVDAERDGPQWACERDPRITRVGNILRKSRIDELPQLLNIIRGEMSFIGPRPEREVFVSNFQQLVPVYRKGRLGANALEVRVCDYEESVPHYSYRLLVKPGLTGWAQVMFPYASSQEETREKLKFDLYYIKNMGFFLDLAIMLRTVRIVLFGRDKFAR
jgi:exopolysaccharide biosynthesis polyprenyl glycosylphosphotransferase